MVFLSSEASYSRWHRSEEPEPALCGLQDRNQGVETDKAQEVSHALPVEASRLSEEAIDFRKESACHRTVSRAGNGLSCDTPAALGL